MIVPFPPADLNLEGIEPSDCLPSDFYAVLPIEMPHVARWIQLQVDRWAHDWALAEGILAGVIHRGRGLRLLGEHGERDVMARYYGEACEDLNDGSANPILKMVFKTDDNGRGEVHALIRAPAGMGDWNPQLGMNLAHDRGIWNARIDRLQDTPQVPWHLFEM